jgi:3-oxoacyl-[acyl-carrier-protein] synthase-3
VNVPNVRIRAIACATPTAFVDASHFASLYGGDEIARIDKATGALRRRRLPRPASPHELAEAAARAALDHAGSPASSADALIYVTQSPDFVLPATACLLQHRLALPEDAIAFDVNLGCSGFVYGLYLAANLVRSGARKRVLLVAGDVTWRGLDESDRSAAPLFGDAYGAAVLEATDEPDALGPFKLGTDGSGWSSIVQYRFVSDFERSRPTELAGVKDPLLVHMNGEEVFAFSLKRVPPLVASVLGEAGKSIADVDYFVYHQANRFMLEALRKKSKIPSEKFLYSIGEFGNTSSASLPITICHCLRAVTKPSLELLLAGFGVGYSWGAVLARVDGAAIGPIVEYSPPERYS